MMSISSALETVLKADDDMSDKGPTLLVDDDKVQCPTAGYTKIQDAINAAPAGATIRICPGTYQEQISVTKSLTLRGDNGAVVIPGTVVANTTSLVSPNAPLAAVILVADTENVTISSLTVDGVNNSISGCGPGLVGIFFRNASGTIRNAAVRNMKLAALLNGCQSGLGIFVQSGNGQMSSVKVEGSSVHDFQKNGITGNESGTKVEIDRNSVTGSGPTSGAAQNGIQVGFGATGSLEGNTVANLIWSPCVSVQACTAVATGILVFESDDVSVEGNELNGTQGGIYIQAGHGEIKGNIIFDTLIFDGIALVGDGNEAQRNSIFHSDESGVFIQGNDNFVTDNQINEAPVGVLKMSGSLGNTISGNRFFNTPVPVQDPSELGSTMARRAYR
jgi:parallel beta-helix repeat protein